MNSKGEVGFSGDVRIISGEFRRVALIEPSFKTGEELGLGFRT